MFNKKYLSDFFNLSIAPEAMAMILSYEFYGSGSILLCLLGVWLVAVSEAVQEGEDVFRSNLIDGATTKLPDERLRTAADCLNFRVKHSWPSGRHGA